MSTNPFAGLGIFQPPDQSKEIAQQAADMQAANDALVHAKKISDFALAQWQEDDITLGRIGREVPPVESALQTKIDNERSAAEDLVLHVIPRYVGDVHGWAAYIQVLRSIESRKPGTIAPEHLVLPVMPQAIADYAAANGI